MAPQVELSTTLYDLYSLDGGNADDVALVYAFPAPTRLAASLPVSTRYPYHSPRMVKLSNDILARFLLSCSGQYCGFIAGGMDLWLFDLDQTAIEKAYSYLSWDKPTPSHQIDAQRVFEVISEPQRPRLHFVETPDSLAVVDKQKAVLTPVDFLDDQRPLINQRIQWDLQSKRALATSDLPSPPTDIVDTLLTPHEINDAALVDEEIGRMLKPIENRPLPFVVKLPLGQGGHAVFVVQDEEKRQKCLEVLQRELPSIFQTLTPETADSGLVSLLIQDFVVGSTAGVSFFITKSGRPIYISCSGQVMDEREYWSGSAVEYPKQEALGEQFGDIIRQVATYVYAKGYYGPMGVDVMTEKDGRQVVVDMNVRQTGSYTLGLMKKHFWEQRGLSQAHSICPLVMRGERDQFEQKFAEEIEAGSLVIAAWCRGNGGPGGLFVYSIAAVLVAAKTSEEAQELAERVNSLRIKKF